MRVSLTLLAALGLAACSPSVPDSGQGVGFDDYDTYLRARADGANPPAAPQSAILPPTVALQPIAPSTGFSTSGAAAAIANAAGTAPEQGQIIGSDVLQAPIQPMVQPVLEQPVFVPPAPLANGELAAVRPRGNAPAGITETVQEMTAVPGGVSDEQDFEAVSARETIESDKARIEQNRAKYQIDQPGALPQRTTSTGTNIVEYALATQHPLGVKLFRRSPFKAKKAASACASQPTEDAAQEAFLSAGGPDRDRLGLDPDGDGYACGWDPNTYRAVAQ
jgi:hypothetical protein